MNNGAKRVQISMSVTKLEANQVKEMTKGIGMNRSLLLRQGIARIVEEWKRDGELKLYPMGIEPKG